MVFESKGAKMYIERQGEGGRPLLLLHGWGGSWKSFLPVVRDFSSDRIVYAVDFPGHGLSPEPPEPWSVTEYMNLLYEALTAEGLQNMDVIAHSFGGRVALLLAAEHPEMVRRLLITGGAGLKPKENTKVSRRTKTYRFLKSAADNAVTRAAFGDKVDAWREELIQKFGSEDYKALTPSMRQTFNRVLQQDLADCLPRITAPTLLVWGTEDTATPIWMGEEMERQIPDAALIRFEGKGHFAYLDDYPKFLAIARQFLGK